MIIETLTQKVLLASVLLIVGLILYEILRPKLPYEVRPRLPKLPIVGTSGDEYFPKYKAMYRNSTDIVTAITTAYQQFKDRACLFPVLDVGNTVVIPPTELSWFLDQPETNLSMHYHQLNAFQFHYTLPDPRVMEDAQPIHLSLVTTKLTRELNNLLPVMAEHIPRSIREVWGTDTEDFNELCLMDELPRIISRVVNRAFVGEMTCNDRLLLDNGIAFAQGLGFTSIILRCMPQTLRPILGRALTIPVKRVSRRFFKALRPEVERRLQELKDGHETSKNNDFLQWIIDAAVKSGDPYMLQPETIMGRVLILNFVSIHTSTFALTHILFDLAAGPASTIEELRDEIASALEAHDGKWNKQTLGDMPKLDSAFRESQRLNPPSTLGSPMPVTNPKGITTPSGLHLNYGTYVCVLSYPILHDPDLYPDPETFQPFRFAERREEADKQGLKIEKARQAWTATSKTYTAFGLGRHACPGRFFASNTLKITLAYILMNYDIEKMAERPRNPTFSFSIMPPLKEKIRFKRRKTPIYPLD